MLCEIAKSTDSFLLTWLALTLITLISVTSMSGYLFLRFYVHRSFDSWQFKTNPKYPAPEMVRDEVLQMLKGVAAATLTPTISLWLTRSGYSHAYCGVGDHGVAWLVVSFFMVWLISDFFEFYYHRLGHITDWGWLQHKYHHVFYNPSPWAVIADEPVDQFIRALPLLLFPLLLPINIDLVFGVFGVFFYAYGVYLHSGFELPSLSAHNKIGMNTAYHHYLHHAKSIRNKPYHTGFMFQIWDIAYGSLYDGECLCVECARKAGLRTRAHYEALDAPNYSIMLQPSFWFETFKKDSQYSEKLAQLAK
jgi:lathosterol oxidase